MSQAAPTPLAANRQFTLFFCIQMLGAFNDNLFKNAVVILIAAKGLTFAGLSPEICITLASGIFILPFFLGSAISGQIADKLPKSRIIGWVKILEIICMGIGGLGLWFSNLPLMLLSVLLLGIHSTLFGPVKYSILPQIIAEDSLLLGNSIIETATFLAILAGTITGGLIILLPSGDLYLTAVSMITAIIGLALSFLMPKVVAVAPELKIDKRLFRPTLEILRLAHKTKSVFLSILGISWFWFYGAMLLQVFPAYAKYTLHAEEQLITLLLACFCIGTAVGSLFVERISGKNLELALVPIGSFGMSLFAIDLSFITIPEISGTVPIAQFIAQAYGRHILIDLFLMAVCGGFFTVPLYTLIQFRVNKKEQSRVIAANNILNAFFMVMASALLALLFENQIRSPHIFLILAGLNVAVAIYIFRLLPEFILRFFAFILSRIMYRRVVTGLENIPDHGPAILICNHISFVDWLIISGSVRRPIRFVMDYMIAATPIMSIFFRMGKAIPIAPEKIKGVVNPDNVAIKENAFRRIHEELKDDELVCIFPEGRITHTGEMNRFALGIERAIGETPVPVIPMALTGLWGSIFSRKDGPALKKVPRRFRAKLELRIGAPVPPEDVRADYLYDKVKTLLEEK